MITLTIRFEKHGQEFDIGPAFPDLSTFYRAASMAFVQPHTLASQLGRLSEEKSLELLAHAYAEGVLLRSEPEMRSDELVRWLLNHPDEFTAIREYAEHRPNFEDGTDGDQPTGARFPDAAPGGPG